jgi:SMI1-KNR4 cell-wall
MYEWLPEKVEQARNQLKKHNIKLGFKFNSPANGDEISNCEDRLGLILPRSYKEFLKFSNGAHLFCSDQAKYGKDFSWWTDTGILIQNTNAIIEFNQNHDRIYIDDNEEKRFISFAYLGYILTGDFCAFDVTSYIDSECKVLDCQHDFLFEDWKEEHVIANSFEEWLIKIFDEVIQNNGRPEYWIPSSLHDDLAE